VSPFSDCAKSIYNDGREKHRSSNAKTTICSQNMLRDSFIIALLPVAIMYSKAIETSDVRI
jgi:hypothetical protein